MNPPGQNTRSTAVNIAEQPKDHIIWSLCSFFYGNPFCLGLKAVIHSIKARDRKMAGDLEGARRHGATARRFNIISAILIPIFFILLIYMIYKSTTTIIQGVYQRRY